MSNPNNPNSFGSNGENPYHEQAENRSAYAPPVTPPAAVCPASDNTDVKVEIRSTDEEYVRLPSSSDREAKTAIRRIEEIPGFAEKLQAQRQAEQNRLFNQAPTVPTKENQPLTAAPLSSKMRAITWISGMAATATIAVLGTYLVMKKEDAKSSTIAQPTSSVQVAEISQTAKSRIDTALPTQPTPAEPPPSAAPSTEATAIPSDAPNAAPSPANPTDIDLDTPPSATPITSSNKPFPSAKPFIPKKRAPADQIIRTVPF